MELSNLTTMNLLILMLSPALRSIMYKHKDILLEEFKEDSITRDLINLSSSPNLNSNDLIVLLDKNGIPENKKNDSLKYFDIGQGLSEAGQNLVINKFKELVTYQVILKASAIKNPVKAYQYLINSKLEFESKSDLEKSIDEYDFGDINIEEAKEELGSPIYSSIPEINNSFIIGGYIMHQLIGVMAAPGCGKSLFCMNETAQFIKDGKKVIYVALGDLRRIDFATRLCSIILEVSIDEVTLNLQYYWNQMWGILGEDKKKNLKVIYIDPGRITIDQLNQRFEDRDYFKKYDICFLDYDTNFLSSEEMYSKGEEIYNMASSWAKNHFELVFLVSQPKVQYYNEEFIPQEAMSESSRKPQIIDVLITIGKDPEVVNKVGILNLAKVRRGGICTHFKYWMTVEGKFKIIDESLYNTLKHSTTVKRMKSGPAPDISDKSIEELESSLSG